MLDINLNIKYNINIVNKSGRNSIKFNSIEFMYKA